MPYDFPRSTGGTFRSTISAWKSALSQAQRTSMTPFRESAIDRTRHAHILVRATNWIGDTVMSMPAVQRLREMQPAAHIAMLCPAKLYDLWQHNPFLNEVIGFTHRVDIRALRGREFHVAVVELDRKSTRLNSSN